MTPVVCIVFGGKSSEHAVSCMSAYNVIQNLDKEKYKLLLVGITKEGESFLYNGDVAAIKDGSWTKNPGKSCVISPNPKHGGLIVMNKNGDFFIEHVDVYFPVLHGKNGEDGTIQGVFTLAQIPYVGNEVVGSALCMDKILTKDVLLNANIPVTKGFAVLHSKEKQVDEVDEQIQNAFGYPVVVKPANAGSSVGITAVHNKKELESALQVAFREDRRILIETMLDVREIECAVLGSHQAAKASCLGEVVKTTDMYDYDTKYIDNTSSLVIPAEIADSVVQKIQDYALRAFSVLDCTGLARVDFFIDKNTGEIYLNEINTLPGFTDISMYPMLWAHSGLDNQALLDNLISLAMDTFRGR